MKMEKFNLFYRVNKLIFHFSFFPVHNGKRQRNNNTIFIAMEWQSVISVWLELDQ